MQAPLESIRVLDLSRLFPGPFCTLLLADLGAEVVKIEDPFVGDYMRLIPPFVKRESAYFLGLNRNKKSIVLNLKSAKGREIFLQLAKDSDVILESFRPGRVDRLGIGYQDVKKVNPRIIYCSLSGYGQNGPYRTRAGHDINYIALGGVLSIMGEADGPPVIPGVQIADIGGGGLLATIAILAALLARTQTDRGQYIDVAMLDGVISWLGIYAAKHFIDGKPLQRGKMLLSGELPCYNIYETKDNRYMALGALEPIFWRDFCKAIGREDLVPHQFAEGKQREAVLLELKTIFRSRTREEWVDFFADKDVCCEPVNSIEEVFTHPQVRHRQMLVDLEHPTEGRLRQVGIPIKFSETPVAIQSPPPRLGEHTEEIVRNLGYSEEEIRELKETKVISTQRKFRPRLDRQKA